jgi:hypothetical protein
MAAYDEEEEKSQAGETFEYYPEQSQTSKQYEDNS